MVMEQVIERLIHPRAVFLRHEGHNLFNGDHRGGPLEAVQAEPLLRTPDHLRCRIKLPMADMGHGLGFP